jgi:predicted ester cyclase
MQDFAPGWFNAFPGMKFSVISGDRAAVIWRVNGIQKGDLPGMPASNKPVEVVGVSVMECSDGKIRHTADCYDFATAMRQMGFLPAPSK